MARAKSRIEPSVRELAGRGGAGGNGELRDRMLWGNALTTAWRLNYIANFYVVPFYLALERRIGISRPEYVILFCAAQHPGVTAQEIVMATGRPKNSISVAVSKLERKQLITRHPSDADSRRMELRVTAKGLSVFQQVVPLLAERERQMTETLSVAQRRQFDALLMKIAQRVAHWAVPDLSSLSPAGSRSRARRAKSRRPPPRLLGRNR